MRSLQDNYDLGDAEQVLRDTARPALKLGFTVTKEDQARTAARRLAASLQARKAAGT